MSRWRISLWIPFCAILLPTLAYPQDPEALQTWGMDRLCQQRDNDSVQDEIDRRDLFSRRELRAISKQKVKTDISEQALVCFMGPPEAVIPVDAADATMDGIFFDAYVYGIQDDEMLVVLMLDDEYRGSEVFRVYRTHNFPAFQKVGSSVCDIEHEACRRSSDMYRANCYIGDPDGNVPTTTGGMVLCAKGSTNQSGFPGVTAREFLELGIPR